MSEPDRGGEENGEVKKLVLLSEDTDREEFMAS
jgi:hypothetical protein